MPGGLSAAVVLLALASACSKPPSPVIERIAVLPFQNLTPDVALDWMGAAAPAVLEGQLASSRRVFVFPARSLSDAYAGGAAQVVHGSLVPGGAGELRMQVIVEDMNRLAASREYSAAAAPAEFLRLMDGFARTLDAAARPYATAKLEALRAFAEALQATDAASAVTDFERSLAADANFGPAYLALAQRLAAQGDSRARSVAEQGLSRQIDEVTRLKLQAVAASLSGNREGEAKAMAALAQAVPADVTLVLAVAESAYRARRFGEAEEAYRRAVAANPGQASTWNLLAYSQAYNGHLEGALRSLEKYRALAPKDPNRADSEGDINLLFGRFEEAERAYLEAYALNQSFLTGGPLHKAAIVRWLQGDVSAASAQEGRFLEARKEAGDPLVVYRQAQWAYLTGKHREAISLVTGALPGLPGEAAPLAGSELTLWLLDAGDVEGARRVAGEAAAKAKSPQVQALALVAKFAASEAGGDEIGALVGRAIPQPATVRDQVLGWALLFRGRYAQAEPAVAGLERQASPEAAARLALLRAWLQVKTGRGKEAAAVASQYPLPAPSGETPFSALVLPRWFFVKAIVLREQGKAAEAERFMGLYRQYAGEGMLAKQDLAQWDGQGAAR